MNRLHAVIAALTQGLRAASLVLMMLGCPIAVVSSQSLASPDSSEGTIHPLLKSSSPELIAGTLKKPQYPRSAKKAGVGAELILEVQVDETGNVTSMGVMRTRSVDRGTCEPVGSPGEADGEGLTPKHREAFASAAADAILQWRYRPATRNGKPIRVLIVQVVRFCPEDGVMTLH